ncbi:hypothetical protein [Palleronia salina]|uniref:hypothetical protein n=1 Tax=Palleronia salina TaxID=313368 RepID=UPI0011148059|nr:hypothetical protein [Palleronia salina]
MTGSFYPSGRTTSEGAFHPTKLTSNITLVEAWSERFELVMVFDVDTYGPGIPREFVNEVADYCANPVSRLFLDRGATITTIYRNNYGMDMWSNSVDGMKCPLTTK